jgi:hypothetical protein
MGNSGLSKLLIRDGLLSKQDCQIIVRESGHTSAAFAKGVVALGIFSEDELARYLSEKTRLPIVPRERLVSASSSVIGLVDIPLLERLEVLPIELKGKVLVVAMADPLDEEVLQQLSFFINYEIQPVITTTTAIHSTLKGVVNNFSQEKSSFQSLLEKHFSKSSKSPSKKPRRAPAEGNTAKAHSFTSDSPGDLLDDADDFQPPSPREANHDSDMDLDANASASSTDLDDFSASDEDVDLPEIVDVDLDADFYDSEEDSNGAAKAVNNPSEFDHLELSALEAVDPFDDDFPEDGDSPEKKAPKAAPVTAAKPAEIDPMALWGDETELADAEAEFGESKKTLEAADPFADFSDAPTESPKAAKATAPKKKVPVDDDDLFDIDMDMQTSAPGEDKPSSASPSAALGVDDDEFSFDGPSTAVKADDDEFSFDSPSAAVKADDDDEFSFDGPSPAVKADDDEFSFDSPSATAKADDDEFSFDSPSATVKADDDEFSFDSPSATVKADDDEFSFDSPSATVKADDDEFSFDSPTVAAKEDADEFSFDSPSPALEEDPFGAIKPGLPGRDAGEFGSGLEEISTSGGPALVSIDSHDYGIGHLNHALGQMALATTLDEAKAMTIAGLDQVNISIGSIFAWHENEARPVVQWSRKQGELLVTVPKKPAVTPALAKFAGATDSRSAWEQMNTPLINLENVDATKFATLTLKIKHPKGPLLIAIAAWPKDAGASVPLKDAAKALIKLLSKKLAGPV